MVHFYFGSGHILEDRKSRQDRLISWCPICWQFLGSRMSFFLTEVEDLPQILPTGEIWSHPRGEYREVCSLLILVKSQYLKFVLKPEEWTSFDCVPLVTPHSFHPFLWKPSTSSWRHVALSNHHILSSFPWKWGVWLTLDPSESLPRI